MVISDSSSSSSSETFITDYINEIFSNLNCLNASFLKREIIDNNNGGVTYYPPHTDTVLNIDFDEMEETFNILKAIKDSFIEVK